MHDEVTDCSLEVIIGIVMLTMRQAIGGATVVK